jgi:hypothetical protein
MNRPALPLLPAAVLLAACAGTPDANRPTGGPDRTGPNAQLGQAATTPLSDLNLVRAEIPPALVMAQKAPYGTPADRSCGALAADVQALDAVLGADLDTPATAANPGLIERGGEAAIGAFRGAAEGVVPFRGWVRKLTGAEKYAREVAAAIAAGTVRRAYLKGLGLAGGCPVPASPRGG